MSEKEFNDAATQNSAVENQKRKRLCELMRDAARHYHANLSSQRAKAANEYLLRRELDNGIITKFGLGYSLDGKDVIDHLKKLGYTESEMKEVGIAELSERGYYDVFYDRVIYPIINELGEVVAFGGRTLKPDPGFAKYRNSSQTVIFDKSNTIYGINLLKKRKQRVPIEYIIMVEGYMDVISLHKAGFDTAVASMGTALTQSQAKQIRNYCDKVYISYDGDSAGQKATMRGLDILVEAGLDVKVVSLPNGLDPDDFIKKYGAEGYRRLLENSKKLTEFKINKLRSQYDFGLPEEKSQFAIEAIRVVNELENSTERSEYISLIHDYTGYPIEVLQRQSDITIVKKNPKSEIVPTAQTPHEEPKIQITGDLKASQYILVCMSSNSEFLDWTEDFEEILTDEIDLKMAEFFIKNKHDNKRNTSHLYNMIDEKYHVQVGGVLLYKHMNGDGERKYNDCVNLLKISAAEKKQNELCEQYKTTKDKAIVEEIKKLTEKIQTLKKRR